MKVYVVMCTSWNGEYDVTSIYQIFRDENKANDFVNTVNSKSNSAYSDTYEVEEYDVI